MEREFHLKFKDKRYIGEWFKIDEDEINLKKISKKLGVNIFTGEMNCEIDTNRNWINDIKYIQHVKDIDNLIEFKRKTITLEHIDRDIFKIINLL